MRRDLNFNTRRPNLMRNHRYIFNALRAMPHNIYLYLCMFAK